VLLFAHIGITAGIVRVCDILGSINKPPGSYDPDFSSGASITVPKKLSPVCRWTNRIRRWLGSIDYRLVLLGSLLPDILDKPPWLIAFGDIFPSGRAYGHTFLFNMVLLICGLVLIKYKKSWLLIISLSSIIHLILDQMWHNPVVLWWPLLGPLQKVEPTGWLPDIMQSLSTNPGAYIPEIIGLIIILLIGYKLITRKKGINFIRTGAID